MSDTDDEVDPVLEMLLGQYDNRPWPPVRKCSDTRRVVFESQRCHLWS